MRVLSVHNAPVDCVTFSPDGTQLADASHDRAGGAAVRVWDLASGELARAFQAVDRTAQYGFLRPIRLAFAPSGSKLAVAFSDVHVYDLNGGKRTQFRWGGYNGGYGDVVFAPDGSQLLAAGQRADRWDASTREPLPKLKFPVPRGWSAGEWPACAFSPAGDAFAVARRIEWAGKPGRNQLATFDAATGAVTAQFEWAGHEPRRVAFSPDGALIVVTGGPVVRVWGRAAQQLVAELRADKKHLTGFAFAPDGRSLATVSKDGVTRRWHVGSWTVSQVLAWGVGELLDVAFSPDGATAAVASEEGKVVLFDVD